MALLLYSLLYGTLLRSYDTTPSSLIMQDFHSLEHLGDNIIRAVRTCRTRDADRMQTCCAPSDDVGNGVVTDHRDYALTGLLPYTFRRRQVDRSIATAAHRGIPAAHLILGHRSSDASRPTRPAGAGRGLLQWLPAPYCKRKTSTMNVGEQRSARFGQNIPHHCRPSTNHYDPARVLHSDRQ
jgi:hypothetical protein